MSARILDHYYIYDYNYQFVNDYYHRNCELYFVNNNEQLEHYNHLPIDA